MSSSQYEPLKQNDFEDSSTKKIGRLSLERTWMVLYSLSFFLGIAIASNIILLVKLLNTQELLNGRSYVGLQSNIPTPILHDNRTIDDQMWNSPEFDTFVGTIALDDDYVEEKGLLPAQRFPWDSSKGIYILHGFHSLHCVFVLRQAIIEFHDNKTQSRHLSHITHCLHVLREDVACYADDLPRYTGSLNDEAGHSVVSSGTGQIRMCRDWGKLREFALQNSACYRRPRDHKIALIDRYKHCPDGSKPWETQV